MMSGEWTIIGPYNIPAGKVEEAMRQTFKDRHGQPDTLDASIIVKWQTGERGQPEIAAGWYGGKVLQLPGSGRDVFWLAQDMLIEDSVDLPASAYPVDRNCPIAKDPLVEPYSHLDENGDVQLYLHVRREEVTNDAVRLV